MLGQCQYQGCHAFHEASTQSSSVGEGPQGRWPKRDRNWDAHTLALLHQTGRSEQVWPGMRVQPCLWPVFGALAPESTGRRGLPRELTMAAWPHNRQ